MVITKEFISQLRSLDFRNNYLIIPLLYENNHEMLNKDYFTKFMHKYSIWFE